MNRCRKWSIRTYFKVRFWRWTGKISIGATDYNRRHDFGHHPFKRAPVPISLFWSFFSKLPMNGQSQKALNLSLFCEDSENREAEFWKMWSTLALARGRLSWLLQMKCIGCYPYVTNLTSWIKINCSFYFIFTSHFYSSFRADVDGYSSGWNKMPCRLRPRNQFEKSLVKPKDMIGS